MGMTEDNFRQDFPTISFGQRKKLLNVIQKYTVTVDPQLNYDPELGCALLSQVDSQTGLSTSNSQSGPSSVNSQPGPSSVNSQPGPGTSSSNFLCDFTIQKKLSKNPSQEPKKSTSETSKPKEPLDVRSILAADSNGKHVIDFIDENQFVTTNIRKRLLNVLFKKVFKNNWYPPTSLKSAVAAGIVSAFPCLADPPPAIEGHSTYYDEVTSTGFIQNKLNFCRLKLTPSKRKNKPCLVTKKPRQNSKSKAMTKKKLGAMVSPNEDRNERTAKIAWMQYAEPSRPNLTKISEAMRMTFKDRREWMEKERPSVTEVCDKYKHFLSYGGQMIDEEFERMFPKHSAFVGYFEQGTEAILQYASKEKGERFAVSSWVKNNNLRALLLVVDLLPLTMCGKRKETPLDLQNNEVLEDLGITPYMKANLVLFPCSGLLQIVPNGTDLETYHSVETAPDNDEAMWRPVYPFLIWVTSDKKEGDLVVKVDQLCFPLGRVEAGTSSGADPFLKAFDILYKIHHVFCLEYHPFLQNFYKFIEALYNMGETRPPPSVKQLMSIMKSAKKK